MPQFVKSVRTSEELFELLLDEQYVFEAKATRSAGVAEWTLKQNFPTRRRFDTPKEARAWFDDKVGTLPKTWRKVADAAPHCATFREQFNAQKAELEESLEEAEADHGGRAQLEKTGVVNWVRRPESRRPKDEFWQLTLTDTTLVARTGKLGTKGRQLEKTKHQTRAEALKYAEIKMRTAFGFLEFGPPR